MSEHTPATPPPKLPPDYEYPEPATVSEPVIYTEAQVREVVHAEILNLLTLQMQLRNEPWSGLVSVKNAYRTSVVDAWTGKLAKYSPGDISQGFNDWYNQIDPMDRFIAPLPTIEHYIKQARSWRRATPKTEAPK